MKPWIITLVVMASVVVIGLGVLAWNVLDEAIRCDPVGLTWSRMIVIKQRILRYAHSHNQLPSTLSGLPIIEGYDDSVRDAWERVIIYEILPSGEVKLTSLGRDGKVGGSGEDADIINTFPSRDAQGKWSDER